jgi:hypothetical protein
MADVLLSQIPLSDIIAQVRQVVKEEISASQQKLLEEKLLSPKEACKLFVPAISRQTLDSISKSGILQKHYLGGKVFFKYSEIMQALKTFKRYEQKKSDPA